MSLLEVMLCVPKFVFQFSSLCPELSSDFLVEWAELQNVIWTLNAFHACNPSDAYIT